ncbi:MAG: nuclear transport factor 2 family protein [Halobacteriota archaeon]
MIGVFLAKKAITSLYEGLNQHNLSKVMAVSQDDAEYVYPSGIPNVSGTYKGKDAIEGWLRNFFDQFPRIQFDIQNICFQNIFDLTGTNVIAVHWDLQVTNRDGRVGENSGVSVINIKGGKAFLVREFIFDQGENFKLGWGAV